MLNPKSLFVESFTKIGSQPGVKYLVHRTTHNDIQLHCRKQNFGYPIKAIQRD